MTRCRCTPTGPECGYCQARIDAAEEARLFAATDDRMADDYADKEAGL